MYLDYYNELLNGYLKAKVNTNIVQIGANDGKINDPIYSTVMEHKNATTILLVEPQPEVMPYLFENYRAHPRCTIFNGAVGFDGNLTLYRLKPSLWDLFIRRYLQDAPAYRVPTGFSSQIKAHTINHIRGNLPSTIEEFDALEELKVPSASLLTILKKNNFPFKIDVLQVDCEGMDDVVLYCCDLSKTSPEIINFEHCHLPIERYKNLSSYLKKLGYLIIPWSISDSIAIFSGSIFFEEFKLKPQFN